MTRDELVEKIRKTEIELKGAGILHKRDLARHLRYMRRELERYDRFQAAARQGVG